jgi:signal transduction histidine kinase
VEDNGIGFDVDEYMARQRTGQGDSTGLENIRFRLEKVMNAHLQVKSTKGIGTVVTLTIPKMYEQNRL